MEQSHSWGLTASQEIPRILWNPKVHYRTKMSPPCPFPQPDQASPCLSVALLEDPSILLLSSHHYLGLLSGLFCPVYPSKPLMHLSGLPHMPHDLPPHPKLILLDLITRIIYDEDHRHNLAKSTGGAKSTMGIRNFNLWRSEVTKRGKFVLNQSLIYIHPFPHSPNFFICTSFNSVVKKATSS
jgi:hypothetical protein